MATRSHPHFRPLDADTLVDLLPGLLPSAGDDDAAPLVVGVEPAEGHVDLHVAPLPDDDRAASAGLFGMRAQDSWCAVGLRCSGRARHLDSLEVLGPAQALVVVDRDAHVASTLVVGGVPVRDTDTDSDTDGPGPAVGLTVDALHRMLGLPSPGEAPRAPLLALAVWSQLVILHTLEHGSTTWADAVALHPAGPDSDPRGVARGGVDPSVETLVEATMRTRDDLDWERMRRRACSGDGLADLTVAEVRWMDATLFGRWVLGSLPDVEAATDTLVAHGEHRTAECLLAVAAAVRGHLGPMNLG